MTKLRASNPELVETTDSTTDRRATGTYNDVTDKMLQDVNIENSKELRAMVSCLSNISETLMRVEKLLQAIAE